MIDLTKKGRPIFIILASICFFVFAGSFRSLSIDNTAIVVAVGIDYDGEIYSASAAIATSKGTAGAGPEIVQLVILGKGITPIQALENVTIKIGWQIVLNYCYLIVLGEEFLEQDIMNALSYFVEARQITDSALLCICKGTAEDLLKATTPLNDVTSFPLTKILYQDDNKSDILIATSIRDLIFDFNSKSKSTFISMLGTMEEKEPSAVEEFGSNVFIYEKTAVFKEEKFSFFLDRDQMKAFCYLNHGVSEGSITLETAYNNKGVIINNITLNTDSKKPKTMIKFENGMPFCNYEISLNLKYKHKEPEDHVVKKDCDEGEVCQPTLLAVKAYLKNNINRLFNAIKENKTDILNVEELFFKFFPKEYREFKQQYPEDFISYVNFHTKINVESKR